MLAVMTPFMFVWAFGSTRCCRWAFCRRFTAPLWVVVGVRGLVLKQQRFMPKWLLAVLLVLAGLIQGMFVSGGAILAIYALQRLQDKRPVPRNAFRAFGWCSISCMPRCSSQGHYTPDCLVMVAIAIHFCSWLRGSATSCG